MIQSYPGTYLLSPIDHKQYYHIDGTNIDLWISKRSENNFRERNPQLGRVEAINESDNPCGMRAGDIVAVNHRTFYKAQVGENAGFVLQDDHTEYEGRRLFRVFPESIFFKYNNHTPEVLPGYALCNEVDELEELKFEQNKAEFFYVKSFSQQGVVTHGNNVGKRVLVKKNAFYLITLDKVDYFKVKESEIVALIENGEAIPTEGNEIVEYFDDEIKHAIFDLSHMKKNNNVTAKLPNGSLAQVWRNNGVAFGGKWLIDDEMILWRWKDGMLNVDAPIGERILL